MIFPNQLDDLIGTLYEAAADHRIWPDFLSSFRTCFRSDVATLYLDDPNELKGLWSSTGFRFFDNYRSEMMEAYFDYYYRLDPFYEESLKLSAGAILTDADLPLDDKGMSFREREFYADWCRPQGLDHATMYLERQGGKLLTIALCRSKAEGAFSPDEIQGFALLKNHLLRSVSLARRMETLQTNWTLLRDAFGRLPLGVIILDRQGRVHDVNMAAASLIETQDGLAVRAGLLRTTYSQDQAQLDRMISKAGHKSASGPDAEPVFIRRRSNTFPLSISVASLKQHFPSMIFDGAAELILFVSASGSIRQTKVEWLQHYYSLTPAEARLLCALTAGGTLRDVATHLSVSHETVRSQLRAVFQKTGINRQADLMRLLLSI